MEDPGASTSVPSDTACPLPQGALAVLSLLPRLFPASVRHSPQTPLSIPSGMSREMGDFFFYLGQFSPDFYFGFPRLIKSFKTFEKLTEFVYIYIYLIYWPRNSMENQIKLLALSYFPLFHKNTLEGQESRKDVVSK